ncbi:MAG: hypothetical protein ACXAC7_15395 [Candidatus Hodarchaeales archaeon]|jgi:hypothetical protein
MEPSVIATTDGGYLLVGYTQSFGVEEWDIWLVKTDSFGVAQWNQTYGGTDQEKANSMLEMTDGGYLLAGRTWSYGAGLEDMWLVRTDDTGVEQWTQTYGGTHFDRASMVLETTDGGYLLAGRTRSFGAGDFDFWLIKIVILSNDLTPSDKQISGFFLIPLLSAIIILWRRQKQKIE